MNNENNAAKISTEDIKPENSKQQLKKMRSALNLNISSKILSMMQSCVNCGLCAEACHYYTSTGDLNLTPVAKLRKFTTVFNRYFHPVKSRIPLFKGNETSLYPMLDKLYKAAYEDCTICGKCALDCPMGIHTGEIMMLARSMFTSIGRLPSGLDEPVQVSIKEGNYAGLTGEDVVDTLEWIGEEMEDDIDDENFKIIVDKKDAEVLFVPHPLEIRDIPFLLMYYIKIMHAAGEDYTFSSYGFDTVNYAYYQGNKENMMKIVQRTLDAREKLQAKSIVLSPCGHGFRAIRFEAEKYFGKKHKFAVKSFIECVEEYVTSGRIKLEKDRFEGPITYHDPCNIARRGGIIQAPRTILKALTTQFIEMEPHGALNYCCGGGGGLASTATTGKIRIDMGKAKADQIRKTGAKIVVTGCFNCLTQIRSLNENYDLGIEAKNFAEVVAGSIISENK
jgi:Fe-S oxidoreductase